MKISRSLESSVQSFMHGDATTGGTMAQFMALGMAF